MSLAIETKLECEDPPRAPDAQNYQLDKNEENSPPSTPPLIITSDEALELLVKLQVFTLGDQKLFDLVHQLHASVQSRKIHDEISSK